MGKYSSICKILNSAQIKTLHGVDRAPGMIIIESVTEGSGNEQKISKYRRRHGS